MMAHTEHVLEMVQRPKPYATDAEFMRRVWPGLDRSEGWQGGMYTRLRLALARAHDDLHAIEDELAELRQAHAFLRAAYDDAVATARDAREDLQRVKEKARTEVMHG